MKYYPFGREKPACVQKIFLFFKKEYLFFTRRKYIIYSTIKQQKERQDLSNPIALFIFLNVQYCS